MEKVLVLGGCGFIGRNLVVYLVENKLFCKLKVVDKNMREISWLTNEQKEILMNVEFEQVDLSSEAGCNKAFGNEQWNYVFNCAGETRPALEKEIYHSRIYQLNVSCAKKAAQLGVKGYVMLSDAKVYFPSKTSVSETETINPWTTVAKLLYEAEEDIRKIKDLNWVILRPAIVYGPSDQYNIMPRLVIGAVYKVLNEKMKLLWDGNLLLHTVHVRDVVAAIWHVKDMIGQIYNLVDSSDTSQETISQLVSDIFKIKYGYHGAFISKTASLVGDQTLADTVNEKHIKPWLDICKKEKIFNTPLMPYLDKDILKNISLNINGSKIISTGFSYKHPKITKELLIESLDGFIKLKIFPNILN